MNSGILIAAQVDAINPEFGGKTPGQRLRNSLYRLFEKAPDGFKTFDEFYRARMEALIEQVKAKIPS